MVKKLKINVLDYVDVGSCKTFTSIEAYNSYNTLKMVLGRKFRGLALDRLSIYFVGACPLCDFSHFLSRENENSFDESDTESLAIKRTLSLFFSFV